MQSFSIKTDKYEKTNYSFVLVVIFNNIHAER